MHWETKNSCDLLYCGGLQLNPQLRLLWLCASPLPWESFPSLGVRWAQEAWLLHKTSAWSSFHSSESLGF